MESWIAVVAGLVLLLLGAEVLVRGAVSLALRFNMSPTTAGLTIVALGTSLPELMITVADQLVIQKSGGMDAGLAVGGIIGSNIFNIGAILGLSAVIFPVSIQSRSIKLEHPFMIVVTLVLGLMIRDLTIDRLEGLGLLVLTAVFVGALMMRLRGAAARRAQQMEEVVSELEPTHRPVFLDVFYVLAGIVCLHFGAQMCVRGARELAQVWGWSEHLIGLTIVAFGTSAPELAVSTLAALRRKTEIAIGNIIGSCIFNITFVLGAGATIADFKMTQQVLNTDLWWLIGFGILMFPLMIRGRSLGRLDGILLMLAFAAYYTSLFLG